mmetsp:Transcript_3139/g.8050  ORF Transcript_3139/g.8050 Transcript_3139/m.8050 type:complete len:400 (+) Transcript_3139:54-1253(+)
MLQHQQPLSSDVMPRSMISVVVVVMLQICAEGSSAQPGELPGRDLTVTADRRIPHGCRQAGMENASSSEHSVHDGCINAGARRLRRSYSCDGCVYTADLRCFHKWQQSYFHRIRDCLLPQYVAVTAARNSLGKAASRNSSGMFCAVADHGVGEVLEPLISDMQFRIIDARATCFVNLSRYAVNKSNLRNWKTPRGILSDARVTLVPNNDRSGLRATQRDALRIGRPSIRGAYVILIARDRARSRRFKKDTQDRLVAALRHSGLSVITYTRTETQAHTISLFAHASGVIGYHGAGAVNTLFSSRPLCMLEITTFMDADFSDNTVWRSNKKLAAINKNLIWLTHILPSRQVWNGRNHSLFGFDLDHQIKYLKWVTLEAKDIASIVARMGVCLRNVRPNGQA